MNIENRANMTDREQIQRAVLQAIDSVNELLFEENAVSKDPETVLVGQGAALDSMGYVNFVVALEETVAEITGLSVNLVDELNASSKTGRTARTVNDFVELLLDLAQTRR